MLAALRLAERSRGVARIVRSLPRALQLVFQAAPRLSSAIFALTLLSGLLPVALLALTKPTIDAVAALLTGDGAGVQETLVLVGAVMLVLVVGEIISAALGWLKLAQGEFVDVHVRSLVHDHSTRIGMLFYEQPDFFDRLHRARDAASDRPVQLVEHLAELGRSTVALTGVFLVLASYAYWLPVLLLLALLPALGSSLVHAWRQHAHELATTVDRRHVDYLDWLLTGRDAAAEVRANALGPRFRKQYREARARIQAARLRLHGREAASRAGLGLFGLGAAVIAVLWMLRRASEGLASLGDVALCYQAFVQGNGLGKGLVGALAGVYRNGLFLEDFFEFLALPTEPPDRDFSSAKRPLDAPPGVRFSDVHFSYPGERRPALQGLDLVIPAGRIVAIVGPNGAGKSTLVKLLSGFYSASRGKIEIGEVVLRDSSIAWARASTSVLFQSSLELSGSVRANIDPHGVLDEASIRLAIAAAGAEALVESLPHGLESRLAAWFPGGTELSGGEWQRIALARAFAKPAPLLVLDEPTSAMDPWAESRWLQALPQHAQGRTVVLITHRLTTAAAAELIHVVADGRVAESGSHQSLLHKAGLYAQLWSSGIRQPGDDWTIFENQVVDPGRPCGSTPIDSRKQSS